MTRASYIVLFAVLFSAPIAAVAQHSAAGSTIYGTSADARISAVDETVARQWNEVLLEAIRGDFARPTVHARNLFHTSIALYDAFALYHEAINRFLSETYGGVLSVRWILHCWSFQQI